MTIGAGVACRLLHARCRQGRVTITDMGPHELWDEPWEGLSEEEAAWEWDMVDEQENGSTKNPPTKDQDGHDGISCTISHVAQTCG